MDAGKPSASGKGAVFNEIQANRIGSIIIPSADDISGTDRAGMGSSKSAELCETSPIPPEQFQTTAAIDLRLPYVECSSGMHLPAHRAATGAESLPCLLKYVHHSSTLTVLAVLVLVLAVTLLGCSHTPPSSVIISPRPPLNILALISWC